MRTLIHLVVRAIDGFTQLCVLLFTVIIFVNLMGRYFLSSTLLWSEQISRYLFIWMCFLGVILVTKERQHLVVDLVTARLPNRMQAWCELLANLLSLLFLVLLGVGGVTILPALKDHIDPPLMIPLSYAFVVIPLFALLTSILILDDTWSIIRALISRSCTRD